ncbi:chromosome partitioning protein, ParB family [Eubacterium pyruvativorans]|uniref:Chromosome partitioning protein, ParB family n=1 Tax=Eubacterium pyruvativorans TaxID=155865 RepID=A0A1I7HSI6_9FIRM|nr:ParB/RepB/Spo0J family partition protein [Eubacterium pyruvativorans]MCI5746531.1 ParB/RepB/Spo0J family partition protein [Eubacterium pyruvativorans]MDD7685048.1 ParB/RepB/Spo0J family partition protein [Eubacterium pyruvativorans]MDY4049849.1 ParB/RepB/Spo0J family partition protein [Eubacterium pyruvativorans]SDF38515.1 chromosome partitioning protein, ParB family [Eubacterium pyruvativorans]SFO30375.1 chromosome partitioning protein, ParB family [Eubacterium pyruvativorans]
MPRTPKKKGLGRGLDALFADQAPVLEKAEAAEEKQKADENSVVYIGIEQIKPNVNQPRKKFNEERIAELAESILKHGIIQPLVVRRSGAFYEIVAGERRWRAARRADLEKVPCIIREFTDEENMLIAIIENLQREDLDPIEEANGLNQMIKKFGMTQEEVSKSISKSRPYISNSLRLLKLPEYIQELVSEGKLSMGHARALISVEDPKLQSEICSRIVKDGLSVRDVEKLVAQNTRPRRKRAKRVKSPDTVRAENRLKEIYGTRVSIDSTGKKGSIRLEYYSSDELNRLLDLLISE